MKQYLAATLGVEKFREKLDNPNNIVFHVNVMIIIFKLIIKIWFQLSPAIEITEEVFLNNETG